MSYQHRDAMSSNALTEGDPVWSCLPVEPEWNPRDDDEEDAGPVHLDHEVAHVTLKVEAHQQRGVVAWQAKKEKRVESVSSTGDNQMSAQPRSTIERSAVKTDAYLQTLLNSMALSGASGVGSAVSSRLDLENFLESILSLLLRSVSLPSPSDKRCLEAVSVPDLA